MTNLGENITVERLELKPEWVENPDLESGDFFSPLILFFLGGFIILLFLGEGLGELLATILTGWISLFFIFAAMKRIKPVPPWKRIKNIEEKQNLPLKRTSDTTERALKGFELSQMMIEKRLRRDFIEKIKNEKGLTEKEMRKLIENPPKLRKIINDEELFNFVMHSKTIKDLIQKDDDTILLKHFKFSKKNKDVEKKIRENKNFEKRMRNIIKRISDWESG